MTLITFLPTIRLISANQEPFTLKITTVPLPLLVIDSEKYPGMTGASLVVGSDLHWI